ncbi:simple sugar transport system permease protein [Clostridium acetobutylicum]|uniref:Sugar ABC transporter, permease protein n=1 Tax=Clostridium acetobutylicum (strain ATCC 824 / DSM 792 / JCM 1419 / IAM 19013 / LMG 5710 / NBRC 13948 / NRRL B-527 / VKM B-1787 / 2291 / W) TaxID=272562 RepID=Q97L57_CLOAB|nr:MULTISPECIES: ABC transporter permease [Clostridium]AAK78682.1 Sugar ABC transporter, permease protein [Clostridium acetobutylicum ATCC 824]ADZ19755.1 Sugar ABC transporter, permease protein [Clostridium acetobutylicum EA 2018]AEI34080.1 sugar ABC transporter, permease protein [Clostridium acetobutylicum DSM 1731]AWV80401.1 ABC transporter permease [Clostridium acetobutylicum]MBC2392590.1 ABC transporter permease [Clostridium acetobutylicum]
MDKILLIIAIAAATFRMATPLIFTAIGGVFSEKSGVVNIGLDGMMTIGAFFAVLGSYLTGSAILGLIFAAVAGGIIALLHAFLSINLKADQVISGTAINLFSTAFASFLIFRIFHKGGQTDIVKGFTFNVPKIIKSIPILGQFISGLNWFVIGAIILVIVADFVLFKTPIGLRIRAVGEHPKAADTMGIGVYKIRYFCVILSGMLAGIGGASLSIGMTPIYRDGMVSGRGFIAIAAMIFGNWKPKGTLWACLLFAFGNALEINARNLGFSIPDEIYSMIPYILTMLALAGFVGKTIAPAADGIPYEKGER